MNVVLSQRLILIIAAVAVLSCAGRRKWITSNEAAWIGAAIIFAATGWVLQAVLNVTRATFPNRLDAIAAGIGLTAPVVLALIIGLIILVKQLKRMSG